MVSKVLSTISGNLHYLILLSVVFGLVTGQFYDLSWIKSYIIILLFLMIYPMMINIVIEKLVDAVKDIKPVLLSFAINFVFSPLLAIILVYLFFDDPYLAVGMYIISVLPISGMTAAWTGLAKGNLYTALILIPVNLLMGVFLVPPFLQLTVGKIINLNMARVFKELALLVFIPMIAGDLTRRLIISTKGEEYFKKIKPNFSGVSSLGVLLVVFFSMAVKSNKILSDLSSTFLIIVPLLIYYFSLLAISHFVGMRTLDRGRAIALVYSCGVRDLTIALGIAVRMFPEAVLLISIGYMIQPPLAAFYLQFLRKSVG